MIRTSARQHGKAQHAHELHGIISPVIYHPPLQRQHGRPCRVPRTQSWRASRRALDDFLTTSNSPGSSTSLRPPPNILCLYSNVPELTFVLPSIVHPSFCRYSSAQLIVIVRKRPQPPDCQLICPWTNFQRVLSNTHRSEAQKMVSAIDC